MRRAAVLLLALGLAGASRCDEAPWWTVRGAITNECVVAVPMVPGLYAKGPHAERDDLRAALRVRDGEGRFVPYVVRPRLERTVEVHHEWTRLRIVSVAETNGQLRVDVAWPDGADVPRSLSRLRISTPLSDFEQDLVVLRDGRTVASGRLCDQSRYADFSRRELALDIPFARRLTLVFSQSVSRTEDASFERMRRARGDGADEVTEVRRGVRERAFRIDGVSVSCAHRRPVFRPARLQEAAVELAGEEKAGETVFEFDACRLPVRGIRLDAGDRNFSRTVRVERRVGDAWRPLATGKVVAMDLPGEHWRNLRVMFADEVRDQRLRVRVENGDSPALTYGKKPLVLLCAPCDVAFIAAPGRRYEVGFVADGGVPRYDEVVRLYIDRVRDPRLLSLDFPEAEAWTLTGATPAERPWFAATSPARLLTVACAAAFLVLLAVCLSLFRGVKDSESTCSRTRF